MDLNIQIDKEAIHAAVVAAIINSSIGAEVAKAVEGAIAALTKAPGYQQQSALEKVVEAEVAKIVQELINSPEHGPRIRAAVQEQLTDELVGRISMAAWNAFMDKLHKVEKNW